jgi:glycyl-tRNA synthetase beta chain
VVVQGSFGERYLALPKEILDTSMRYHQKMFSLEGEDGRLLPSFLTVVNNEDPEGLIARGEAQVLDARLQDAVFFWEKDCERGLGSYAGELPRVVFQERLGSYADKVARMREVAPVLGEMPGLEEALDHCKADLCTLTVGEFPELQGIVGGLLASAEEMPEDVAAAIRGQYDPLAMEEPLTHALALLDNLDTLVGCSGVGLQASGSKDPFGLRRAAYTLARILAGGTAAAEVEVGALLDAARRSFREVEGFHGDDANAHALDMLKARLRFHLQEDLGFPYDETNAVLEAWWEKPADAVSRLSAVNQLRGAGGLEGLSEPLKRARNILKKAALEEVPQLREESLGEGAERDLFAMVEKVASEAAPLLEERRYRAALEKMADLRPAVDRFFEEVLVMDEDPDVRANRLSLLERVRSLFLKVADLGEIVEQETRTEDQQ